MLLIVFGMAPLSANAELVNNGNGIITDTSTNLMWLHDANYASTSGYDVDGMMTWYDAKSWAENLVFAGYDDWRLPSALNSDGSGPTWAYRWDPPATDSEIGHLYYIEGVTYASQGQFYNVQNWSYWYGTEYSSDPNIAWEFAIHNSEQVAHNLKSAELYGWAVRNGAPAVTPEPISCALFLFGAGALAGVRRLRMKT